MDIDSIEFDPSCAVSIRLLQVPPPQQQYPRVRRPCRTPMVLRRQLKRLHASSSPQLPFTVAPCRFSLSISAPAMAKRKWTISKTVISATANLNTACLVFKRCISPGRVSGRTYSLKVTVTHPREFLSALLSYAKTTLTLAIAFHLLVLVRTTTVKCRAAART